MIHEKIEKDEQIRFEALIQSLASCGAVPMKSDNEILKRAKLFEKWIREGSARGGTENE